MPVISCPSCSHRYSVPDLPERRRFRCGSCGHKFKVGDAQLASVTATLRERQSSPPRRPDPIPDVQKVTTPTSGPPASRCGAAGALALSLLGALSVLVIGVSNGSLAKVPADIIGMAVLFACVGAVAGWFGGRRAARLITASDTFGSAAGKVGGSAAGLGMALGTLVGMQFGALGCVLGVLGGAALFGAVGAGLGVLFVALNTVRPQRQVARPQASPRRKGEESAPATSHRPVWLWFAAGAGLTGLLMALVAGVILAIVLARPTRDDGAPVAGQAPTAATQPKAADKPSWPGPDAPFEDTSIPDPPVGPDTVARIEYTVMVDAVGNADAVAEVKAAAERVAIFRRRLSQYLVLGGSGSRLRERPPKAKNFLAMMDPDRGDSVVENLDGEFTPTSIQVKWHAAGMARRRGGKWVILLSPRNEPFQLVKKQDSRIVTLRQFGGRPGNKIVSQKIFTLPEGAREIEVTKEPNELRYRLPEPVAKKVAADCEPSFEVIVKPHILGALAKQYADPQREKYWPARSVLRNTSGQTLTDYRVRFRIPGFAGAWSEWSATETIFPDQVVVDSYHSKLDSAKIAALKSPEPVDVEIEYEYTGPDGKKTSAKKTAATKILPINEGVYSHVRYDGDTTWLEAFVDTSDILASFVTPNDPVVREVVDLVARSVGVKTPLKNDKDAMLFLKGLWMLMRTNIHYELTGGGFTDGLIHQHLMYPRDVLREKGALCVNTSIFLASVAESAGLKSHVVVIPGHAFPWILLPDGKPLIIESTGIGGGTIATSVSFATACKIGEEEVKEAVANSMYIEVDIADARKSGVVPPELPALEEGMLAKWGITMPAKVDEDAADGGPPRIAPPDAWARVTLTTVERDVVKGGRRGAMIRPLGKITKAKGCPCAVLVTLFDEGGQIVKTRDRTVSDADGNLLLATVVTPNSDDFTYIDVELFLPDAAVADLPADQKYLGVVLITNDGKPLNRPEDKGGNFLYTK